jgi:hypothetical protein
MSIENLPFSTDLSLVKNSEQLCWFAVIDRSEDSLQDHDAFGDTGTFGYLVVLSIQPAAGNRA